MIMHSDEITERDAHNILDMSAQTEKPDDGLSFTISLNDYTIETFEQLLIEAAARQLLNRVSNKEISIKIEQKVMNTLIEKSNKVIDEITSDVLNRKITNAAWFYSGKTETISEHLKLLTSDYISKNVNRSKDRVDLAIERVLYGHLGKELDAQVGQFRTDVAAKISEYHTAEIKRRKKLVDIAINKSLQAFQSIMVSDEANVEPLQGA